MSSNNRVLRNAISACLAGGFVVSVPGFAQGVLEEVVVTAQKRSESLQDVPISLSVVGGETLDDFKITDFTDFKALVPNFYVQDTPGNYGIFLRGMGSTSGNLAVENTVGLFIDGVYAGRARQYQSPFLDIERIEVLRGPQGALVGKNTSAGAVSITTRKPTDEFEASIAAGYEFVETDAFNSTFILSGPITDFLLGRVAVSYTESDGYVDNVGLNTTEPEKEDLTMRGTLLWDATDNLEIIAKLESSSSDINGNAYETELNGKKPDYKRSTNGFPGYGKQDYNDTDSLNFTLTANYDFSGFTLTSITGYSEYDFDKFLDSDFTADTKLGSTFAEEFDQFSQELRLVSPGDEKLTYVVGAYYHTSNYDLDQETAITFGPFNGVSTRHFEQDQDVWSVYAQATYYFTDAFSVSGSVRQTNDSKDGDQQREIVGGVPPTWLDTPLSDSIEDDNFDVSMNVQWNVSEEIMLYASYAEGSKAGAFVGAQATTTEDTFTVGPETAETYEVGAKTTLLDNSMTFNAAYYYTEYDDLQVSTWDPDSNGFITKNAASATTEGVELDAVWAISDSWTVRGGVAYLDAKYDEFIGGDCLWNDPDCDPETNDLGGLTLPRSAEWTGYMNVIFEQPIGAGLLFQTNLGLAYSDDRQLTDNQDPYARQDAFTKVDLRVALSEIDQKWTVALVGKNLTDETTFSHAFGTPFSTPGARTHTYLVDPPLTVSIQGEYRF